MSQSRIRSSGDPESLNDGIGGTVSKPISRIRSDDLFQGADEHVIEHNGRRYLLRKKPLGGLVLTGFDDSGA